LLEVWNEIETLEKAEDDFLEPSDRDRRRSHVKTAAIEGDAEPPVLRKA